MAAWIGAIPIIGKVIEKALDFAAKRWGYNPKEQELKEMAQEITSEANILDAIKELINFIVEYEAPGETLTKFGIFGKIIMFLRATWRPALQWGMTIKVLQAMFWQGKSIEEMQTTIAFVAGLAILREVGKKLKTKET